MRLLLVFAALGLMTGCAGPASGDIDVRWLGYEEYVANVQPILAEACGNPSCHGRADRPFAIYSAKRWRADADRLFLDEPLTDDELEHNYSASCVFSTEAETPQDAMLLRKPLGSHAGAYHGGGDVFRGVTDRDYRKILQWIEQGW